MGESKRRKMILGDKYGTPETSNPLPKSLVRKGFKPDYGAYCLKAFGKDTVHTLFIANPVIAITNTEGFITWKAGDYVGTLITPPEFARQYRDNPNQLLMAKVDPDDTYSSQTGETVVPFKLVEQEGVDNSKSLSTIDL